ncbi:response regulator [Undibacterium sp. RuTC16W]|uniref:response regulator n=1 Tax=Undibacterium sp. RuTC16W TaxID=3413048 RepID=UPI003BEF6140
MRIQTHILLVEDDQALRTMLRSVFELNDYRVDEAESRLSALAKLKCFPDISIVVLDLGLPPCEHTIEEGIATLKSIQADILPVKILVLTGQDQDAAALQAIREGAFDFITKPAAADTLLSAVRRASLFLTKERELGEQGITRIAINAQAGEGLKGVRTDAEERVVRQVLKETGFNVNKSAKRLGIKRENIYYFLKKFGIERDA